MAREGLRSHLSGSVPISIGLHLVALLLVLISPLVADVSLPRVWVDLPDYVRLAPMPPPPAITLREPPPSPQASPGPVVTNRAPTEAPLTIEPQAPRRLPTVPIDGPASSTGFPPGMGFGADSVSSVVIPVPDPPRPAGPVRVAQLPVAPTKIVDARPLYPEIARSARVEGTVVLEAVLDQSGRVTQLRVIQSVPMLNQAALDAVRQWRYTPSIYGGQPVSVLMTITIRFKLQ